MNVENSASAALPITELPKYKSATGPVLSSRLTGIETVTVLTALCEHVEQRAQAVSDPAAASRLRSVAATLRARANHRSASLSTTSTTA